jgi:predicted nuclease of predicted toxin-antitoxin system
VRLLFDEQLSEKLVNLIADIFPNALHVRAMGAGGWPDHRVWQLARDHDCVLTTKDEDFHRLSVLQGAPPKVLWIRIGNCSSEDVAALLRKHEADIREFAGQSEATFLQLGA